MTVVTFALIMHVLTSTSTSVAIITYTTENSTIFDVKKMPNINLHGSSLGEGRDIVQGWGENPSDLTVFNLNIGTYRNCPKI